MLQTDLHYSSCSSFTLCTFLPTAEKGYCRKKDALATVMQMIEVLYSGHTAKCSIEKEKKKKKTHNQVIGSQARRVNYCLAKIIFKEENTLLTDH